MTIPNVINFFHCLILFLESSNKNTGLMKRTGTFQTSDLYPKKLIITKNLIKILFIKFV